MIKIENTNVVGLEPAIRGMRNPMNSWDKSDSGLCVYIDDNYGDILTSDFRVGQADHELMMELAVGGSVHAKYRRMIVVYVDITAPLYWWKEFDTYKVGTVANSCSTMHKIHAKEFTLDDFSTDHLGRNALDISGVIDVFRDGDNKEIMAPIRIVEMTIEMLNTMRKLFLDTNDKKYWWQMIQLLPSSYNQKRTVMLNYEVLAGIYPMRKDHKLDEWREFCHWIECLPYSEIIICNVKETDHD